ncbi:hypothetical protein Chor_002617 [Crotalus horridus]
MQQFLDSFCFCSSRKSRDTESVILSYSPLVDINMDEQSKSVQLMTKEVKEQTDLKKPSKSLLKEFYNKTSFQVVNLPKFPWVELTINIALFPLGAMFASVIAGFLADTLGRKNSLVVVNITAMTSSVLMSVESFVLGIEFTFLAHLITGLSLVLKMLRETDDVDNEIEEMSQEDLAEGNNKDMTPLKLIRTPSMRWHIITIVVIMAGSQLNGISVMYLVDNVGRRILLLTSFACCSISSILLIVSLELQKDLGYYCFVVFWPFCIGTIVYIYKMVPETKTQTFSEIKRVMSMKTTKRFRSRESRRKLKLKRHV